MIRLGDGGTVLSELSPLTIFVCALATIHNDCNRSQASPERRASTARPRPAVIMAHGVKPVKGCAKVQGRASRDARRGRTESSGGLPQALRWGVQTLELRLAHIEHELEEAGEGIAAHADLVDPGDDLAFAVGARDTGIEREHGRALEVDSERHDRRPLSA